MLRQKKIHIVIISLILFGLTGMPSSASAEGSGTHTAFNKLTRGLINVITGWVEIPKKLQETTENSGAATGFTWGLMRGLGHSFIRTAAGVYEVVTFPFPAPPDYAPVIRPEYVFSDDVVYTHETSPYY